MLVRLLLEEIPKYWELIQDSLQMAMCPTGNDSPEAFNYILEELLCGNMQAWASFDEETRQFSAMLVTSMFEDLPTKTKNFVLYSFTAYKPLAVKDYASAFETLSRFARAAGCARVIAYTENERFETILGRLASRFGGKVLKFVTVPL